MREKILSAKDFVKAFDAGEEINERTLIFYARGGERLSEDSGRWSYTVDVVVHINGRYFRYSYQEGKTEMQPDACYEQPVEVLRVGRDVVVPEHIVHVVEWIEKEIDNE